MKKFYIYLIVSLLCFSFSSCADGDYYTEAEIEDIKKEAYAEGYYDGHSEGEENGVLEGYHDAFSDGYSDGFVSGLDAEYYLFYDFDDLLDGDAYHHVDEALKEYDKDSEEWDDFVSRLISEGVFTQREYDLYSILNFYEEY